MTGSSGRAIGPLDGPGSTASRGARIRKIIDVIAHSHEQVKEQLSSHLHLHLHGSTTLKGFATADNQSEVMSAQTRVTVWRVLVGIARTTQDGSNLDPALQALLAQGELLELFEAVTISSAVYGCVTENDVSHARMEKGWLDSSGCAVARRAR
jgi:hypothetical protein